MRGSFTKAVRGALLYRLQGISPIDGLVGISDFLPKWIPKDV